MTKKHNYQATIEWTGNKGEGTSDYKSYERSHSININGKSVIEASSDPSFRGDPSKHNPEELFLASLSSCHMLWFLHLCTVAGVIVTDYVDKALGTMLEEKDGKGRFTEVILNPEVTVTEERMATKLDSIHQKANKMCFIANSCNFPVRHHSSYKVASE
ncbi:MAG: OsmC family protein [Balneolaceae bacterium]|nr:OsmC family protein [Balneolaceae bacterium]MBO6545744.1 OsmC family protein [Balneolaceae bacterium]MBO6647140.1 OsmC family protein [Balneolaceae bacterium]